MTRRAVLAALAYSLFVLLSGCAANYAEQARQLPMSGRCCVAVSQVPAERRLGIAAMSDTLDRQSAVTHLPEGYAPASGFALPDDAAGRVLELTALSDIGPIIEPMAAVFVPMGATFLDRNGQVLPAGGDTGYLAANGGSAHPFLVCRQYRVPAGANRVIVHAAPSRFGTRQVLDYRTSSFMRPASGVYVAFKGREAVTAIWSVYGAYQVQLRRTAPGA